MGKNMSKDRMELTINWVNSLLADPETSAKTVGSIFKTYTHEAYPERLKVIDGVVRHKNVSKDTLEESVKLLREIQKGDIDAEARKEVVGIEMQARMRLHPVDKKRKFPILRVDDLAILPEEA